MLQGRYDLLLGEPRPVVSFDQQRDASAFVDVPRLAQCLIENAELLEEVAVLLQGSDGFRAART
jgi:hypothetical protein